MLTGSTRLFRSRPSGVTVESDLGKTHHRRCTCFPVRDKWYRRERNRTGSLLVRCLLCLRLFGFECRWWEDRKEIMFLLRCLQNIDCHENRIEPNYRCSELLPFFGGF
ncbi:hypothetical protein HanIR_Chr09g0427561 [Helianthus annuus]|nr:hypothetical protein HanIR_Chr09g0427561 [Helianthus annuus]